MSSDTLYSQAARALSVAVDEPVIPSRCTSKSPKNNWRYEPSKPPFCTKKEPLALSALRENIMLPSMSKGTSSLFATKAATSVVSSCAEKNCLRTDSNARRFTVNELYKERSAPSIRTSEISTSSSVNLF